MKTEITENEEVRRWVFFDGECAICRGCVARYEPLLRNHQIGFAPQQMPWVREKLGLPVGKIFPEIKVLTETGQLLGGADAMVYLAQFVGWARPIRFLARFPGVMAVLRLAYRWVARGRYCFNGRCKIRRNP